MGAPTPVIRIEGFDADGIAKVYTAEASVRTLHFDSQLVITRNDTANPPRIEVTVRGNVAAIEARVAAIEAKLDGTDLDIITVDTLRVRVIEAYEPSVLVPSLTIQTPTVDPEVKDTVIKVVAKNSADITPVTKLGFFGVTPVSRREISAGFTVGDLQDDIEELGLSLEV